MIGTSDIGAVLAELIVLPILGYMGLVYHDGISVSSG
jgi:hypothetical protein